LRIANSDARRGKSGGYRTIYYLPSAERVVLLTIYSKSDQADISAKEIGRIIEDELGA
jgi:mRNA-degrading endonuclease RelE of RelBE toxin-antitoxin system